MEVAEHKYQDYAAAAISLWKVNEFGFIYEDKGRVHEKQKEALYILTDDITKECAYGGAAGGAKSWTGCAWLLFMATAYPDTKWFIGREELIRLKQSTYVTFQKVAKRYGFRMNEDWWYNANDHFVEFANGSRIDFLDVKYLPKDPDYERFGSLEFTGGWLEEGGEIHHGAYDTLKTRVGRHNNDRYGIKGKILVTLNPKKNWIHSVFWKPFKAGTLPKGVRFLQALVTDNPFIDSGYIENLHSIQDKVRKQRLLNGNFDYDDDDNALMDFDSITDIFNNDFVSKGEFYITADIARFGKDKSVIMVWCGWRVVDIKVLIKKKTTEVAAYIKDLARKYKIPVSRIVVDEDGVGGGVVDIINCKGFVNGSSALEELETPKDGKKRPKPNYFNLRSQCYFRLASRININELFVETEDYGIKEAIIEELEQIKKKDVGDEKKLQVVAKADMIELLGRSPDYADTLMMREYFELKPPAKPQDLTKYF